jgi:hypothetical protein
MFILQTVTTKPANVAWRVPATIPGPNSTTMDGLQWTLSQPGVVSSVIQNHGPNTRISYVAFTDSASADALLAARDAVPEFQARAAYRAAHGMTNVVTKLQPVA